MKRWLRLDRLFALRILPIALLIAVMLSLFQSRQLQESFTHELEHKEAELLRLGTALLAAPLWQYKQNEVHAFGNAMAGEPDITGIEIRDRQGRIIFTRDVAQTSGSAIWRQAPIVFHGEQAQHEVGTIRIAFSRSRLTQSILQATTSIFLAIGLMALLIVWLALRFHYRHVLRPLNAMLAAMRGLHDDGVFRSVSVQAAGEVGDALRAFNSLGRQLDQAQEEIRHQASHDRLTSLLNRTGLHEGLQQWILAYPSRRLGLLQLDVNHFRWINEGRGPLAGNALLHDIACRLIQVGYCLEGRLLTRLGNDEFVIAFADCDADTLADKAQRVQSAMQEPFWLDDEELFITFTLGGALFPAHASTTESLIKALVMAVQRAKMTGLGQYQLFKQQPPHLPASDMIALVRDLHHALRDGNFSLMFQPIFSAKRGRVTGAEALIRLQHPMRGMMSPDTFIPVAEETGLIVPIGEWVIDQGLAWLKRMDTEGIPELTLSFNVSACQLHHGGFVTALQQSLASYDLDASRIILEMTENLIIDPEPRIASQFDALRKLGCRLAIDDFGTGYSSLSYLQTLPFDIIKVDRSFVHDGPPDDNHTLLVRTIIDMGHALGLSVTVEGVETATQAERFLAMGADRLQGYHYSCPLEGEAFARWLSGVGAQQPIPPKL